MGEPIFTSLLLGGSVVTFLLWLVKRKFSEIDDLDTRVTRIETRMDVLGDISESLQHVSTDVAVIKQRVENLKEDLDEYNK